MLSELQRKQDYFNDMVEHWYSGHFIQEMLADFTSFLIKTFSEGYK